MYVESEVFQSIECDLRFTSREMRRNRSVMHDVIEHLSSFLTCACLAKRHTPTSSIIKGPGVQTRYTGHGESDFQAYWYSIVREG